ncbi:hypothetical protein LZD49_13475 [Dyadobacter sp. CY261]|uniref:hypothetical protein n=1 Tax=Dyadobacter sp. CY261 TaxID=2907203 RepID=UPI001F328946|nr:hypothetical protein [Dyadobacter sp. CY261]MCF0071486.1 hypothetical protein [Dyadobacter sp. CY261]
MKIRNKILFAFMLSYGAYAQNELITPASQLLRLNADNVNIKQKISLNSDTGYVSIGGYRFLSIKKTAAGELNTFAGPNSGNFTMTGRWNTFMGENAGLVNTTGYSNLAMGAEAGAVNTTGYSNIFVGEKAGRANTTGFFNTMVGGGTGFFSATSSSNVFLGLNAGSTNNSTANVFIGRAASYYTENGSNNVSIGFAAGSGTGATNTNGTGNVLIGPFAGYYETGSNKLYIANSNTTTPMIYGEFPTTNPANAGKLVFNTRAGVGVTTFPTSVTINGVATNVSSFKMFVNGGLVTRYSILTGPGAWADYVFNDNYALRPLNEVESFIQVHGHLPGVPSARQVAQWGIDVGKMARIQQEKIEELTLYIIAQNKKLEEQKVRIKEKMEQLVKLSKEIDHL